MELIDVLLWAASAPEDHIHKVQLLLQRISPPNKEWIAASQEADDRQEVIDRLIKEGAIEPEEDAIETVERIAKRVGAKGWPKNMKDARDENQYSRIEVDAYQPRSKVGKRWWKYLNQEPATAVRLANVSHGNPKAIATMLLGLMKRGIVQRDRVDGTWVYSVVK